MYTRWYCSDSLYVLFFYFVSLFKEEILSSEIFSFVIYMIHACANRWRKTAAQVYFALKQSGCLNHYLIPNYDILHTQSTDFVVKDIEEYLAQKEVIV